MDNAHSTQHLSELLKRAATSLKERGNFEFFSDDPDIFTTADLAAWIEAAAGRLELGNSSDGKRLWLVFAPTCTWDDAGGDSCLGHEVFEVLDGLYRPY